MKQNTSLFFGENNFISNASYLVSYLFHLLENVNWIGFYMIFRDELIIAPFQGKTACVRLPKSNGVCWKAIDERKPIIVGNVKIFPGHIACDSSSKSEIVIPLFFNQITIGVLDIDSPIFNRFTNYDLIYLQEVTDDLLNSSDIPSILSYYSN